MWKHVECSFDKILWQPNKATNSVFETSYNVFINGSFGDLLIRIRAITVKHCLIRTHILKLTDVCLVHRSANNRTVLFISQTHLKFSHILQQNKPHHISHNNLLDKKLPASSLPASVSFSCLTFTERYRSRVRGF